MRKPAGLFVAGTDTGVGKTYVAALVVRALAASGLRVGVYKPVASGCRHDGDELLSDDAVSLWEAAGRPGTLEQVCPQRFVAPLAPHLAARAEGRRVDPDLLRSGLEFWRGQSEVVVVEGVGGLMSPVADEDYVADLAADFKYPLVIVARNALGVINQTLQTLFVAATFRRGLPIAGIVLNDARAGDGRSVGERVGVSRPSGPDSGASLRFSPGHPAIQRTSDEIGRTSDQDPSVHSNRDELARRAVPPVLAQIEWNAKAIEPAVDWLTLARGGMRREQDDDRPMDGRSPGEPGG